MENLKAKAYKLRENTLDIIMAGGGGHIGGDMSVMETLVALYYKEMNISPENQNDPNRDYFILSKGHSVEAYYAVLCDRGFLDYEDVKNRFSKFGSPYLGNRMSGRNSRTYVVMGDGELAEGSVWEGFMSGHMYKLDSLCAVIDRNHLQISGNTEDVMAHEVLRDRVASFGWHVISVEDGNDLDQMIAAFEEAKKTKGQPTCILADTVKGKGSPVMENKASWHHHVPTAEEYDEIMKDLKAREEELSK